MREPRATGDKQCQESRENVHLSFFVDDYNPTSDIMNPFAIHLSYDDAQFYMLFFLMRIILEAWNGVAQNDGNMLKKTLPETLRFVWTKT